MKIQVLEREITDISERYYLELDVNNKIIEISIQEDYNSNGDYYNVDWEFINEEHNLTDEEFDFVDDWVNSYKYKENKK